MTRPSPSADTIRQKLIVPTAAVVLLAWVASLVGALWKNNYTPLSAVTPVMLIMVGYVFGISMVRGGGGNGGKHTSDSNGEPNEQTP